MKKIIEEKGKKKKRIPAGDSPGATRHYCTFDGGSFRVHFVSAPVTDMSQVYFMYT